MLYALLGNKSVEKILIFLLVNEKAYPTQLHRFLNSPLTPLQKALEKLEKGGILTSHYEGKSRFYTFNSSYPLLQELEALLKKAYSLLAPREKSHYFYVRHFPHVRKQNQNLVDWIWTNLGLMRHVTFQFRSGKGQRGFGHGEVAIEKKSDSALIFNEKGKWKGLDGQEFFFRNVFAWTLNRIDCMITLEHLRFGPKSPVFLFHLIPAGQNFLESAHAHLCGQDSYFGHLYDKEGQLELIWRILGPKKNDEVIYIYSKTT